MRKYKCPDSICDGANWHTDPCHLIGGTYTTRHSLLLPSASAIRKSYSPMGNSISHSTVRIILVPNVFEQWCAAAKTKEPLCKRLWSDRYSFFASVVNQKHTNMATTTDIPTFASISNIDLKDLIDTADSNNTKKQIKYGINRLDAYAKFVGTTSISAVSSFNVCPWWISLSFLRQPMETRWKTVHEKVTARNPLRVGDCSIALY